MREILTKQPYLRVMSTLLMPLLLSAGCTTTKIPLTQVEVPMVDVPGIIEEIPNVLPIPWIQRGAGDFSDLGWREAFNTMHLQLVREYPFSERKAIDWDRIYGKYAPRVAEAELSGDQALYYQALRGYFYALPDANIHVELDKTVMREAIDGSYGFQLYPLDDGRLVVVSVSERSDAAKVGMKLGTEILAWNGIPIQDALQEAPILWAEAPPATQEHLRIAQARFLSRAPVGQKTRVTFKNPDAQSPWVTTLQAMDDDFVDLQYERRYGSTMLDYDFPFENHIIGEETGYVKIFFEGPTLLTPFPANAFGNILDGFSKKEVSGLIIDLRGNFGGDDAIAAKFLGYFFQEERRYRKVTYYDEEKKVFVVSQEDALTIQPEAPYIDLPIAVLIDAHTQGAGEAIAQALSSLDQVTVIGATASRGAHAVMGGEIIMPGGYVLYYPVGRISGIEGMPGVESDASGRGGVVPDIRIPATLETAQHVFVEEKDLPLHYALDALKQER